MKPSPPSAMRNLHLLVQTFSQAHHASGIQQINGLEPSLTLLLNAPGRVAPRAPALIAAARRKMALAQCRLRELAAALHVSASGDPHRDLVAAWQAVYAQRTGADLSAVDWSIVNQGLGLGVDPDTLASALAEVADRKGRHAESYAKRTLQSAIRRRS